MNILDSSTIVWKPTPELLESCYVHQFMKKLGFKTLGELHAFSTTDLTSFWNECMKDLRVEWFHPYETVVDESKGIAWTEWFKGGKTNLALNCVDRNARERPNSVAILWEGDNANVRSLTYREFYEQVNQTANALLSLGLTPQDTVGILMPMVPEVMIQMFACFKLGLTAIPIFSGFGPEAVRNRLEEAKAKVLFTADIGFRRGKKIPIKEGADKATDGLKGLVARIVLQRAQENSSWDKNLDRDWTDFVLSQPKECPTARLPSEHPSLILFTSGTTGKPKGAVHTHAGCLATVGKELRYAFNADLSSRFFWFTDIGWMMGPWEMIGVSLFGGTTFLYEGAPDYPTPSRVWEIIERHQLTHLGISPTAIRLLMKSGEDPVKRFNMPSLKTLGSTGEPWDPESYQWYFNNVGKKRIPIINISGGTEIIGCILSPLPISPLKSCSLGGPGLGVLADVFDENGNSLKGEIGHLVIKRPIPSMTKGFLNSKERYLETYFSKFDGVWYHGDWAHVDKDGQWFLHGRSDDTIKIAGKRIGPVEYEASLLSDSRISEAAAIGVPDAIKGESCVCFLVLKPGIPPSDALRDELLNKITAALGKSMAPSGILFAASLPKTRSAKILRGLIRKVYLGQTIKDTASVENLDSLDHIRKAINPT